MAPDALVLAATHRQLRVCFPPDVQPSSPQITHPPPTALHWFPTGNLIAAASLSASLTFLTPPTLSPVGQIASSSPSSSRILSLSISTASRFLAFGRSDGVVSVLDLVSKAPMTSFTLSAPVLSVSFHRSPDARYLACATSHAVSLFSRVSNRLVARFPVSSPLRPASFSTPNHSRPPPAAPVAKITNVAFSPAHLNFLVVADESGCINVWDVAKNLAPRPRTDPNLNAPPDHDATYARFTSSFRAPVALSFAPTGCKIGLCVGGFDKQLRFFDHNLKKFLFSVSCGAPVSAVSFASDGQHLAVGLTNGKMQVLSIDAEKGTGKVVSEVIVDENEKGDPTAVRSVHFQPFDSAQNQTERGIRKGFQDANRPFPLAGIAMRASPMKKQGAAARESGNSSDESDLLLTGLDKEDGEYVDSIGDGLDALVDPKKRLPTGTLRSAAGPRDSDIFSPVVSRTPNHTGGCANGTSKASSIHETPPTSERRAKITLRTPRSRSIQGPTPRMEGKERIDGDADPMPNLLDANHENGVTGDLGETDRVDSDSLDSISGKSSPKTGSAYTPQGDMSQLQGSTFSDDVGHAFSDEREENTSRGSDRGTLSSPPSRSGNEMSPSHDPYERQPRTRFPRSSSQGNDRVSGTAGHALPRHSSVPEKMARPIASVTFESPGKRHDGIESERPPTKTAGMQFSGGSSNTEPIEELPSHHRLPASIPGASSRTGVLPVAGNADWKVGFVEQMRQVIAQELDTVKAELRSDILNTHSEMVVMSARLSQELKAAFVERDRRIKQLETLVRQLQGDNERLRSKYGLP